MKVINHIIILSLVIPVTSGCNEVERIANFIIANQYEASTIVLDKSVDSLIIWAANDLANDIERITGNRPKIVKADTVQKGRNIYIGEISSTLITSLNLPNKNVLTGEWEKFHINISDKKLIISGSDIRGTVYGVFELAEQLGISPWKWWGDVTPLPQNELAIKIDKEGITQRPSVQYRGIFLNDEDWGLQPWAAKTFEPETNDIGPKTYEKIFQLLLRLKANTIWPAMHPSTKAFFSIPGNMEMAEKYHIVIGTSHAEPMLRNNVDEWDAKASGDFNYITNSGKVKEYWQERISESQKASSIITLGMRGIHDSGMEGNASAIEKVKLLENIIADQSEMLTKTLNKPIEDIPQVFTIYKEVLDIYNNGLKVPHDVTLMWTDDNYGYIRRLSNTEEQKRKGGSGVYYHLSYWGRPHDYLWLSTTQPGLIWYELSRAYQNGAQKIWIANVGDIKPGEYAMEFFLDLAWNINSINETTIKKHLVDWGKREFGQDNAEAIAVVMDEYYRLAFLRKPEYMGWSQTEPITQTRITDFNGNTNNNEVQRRIDAYAELVKKVDAIKALLPKERQHAFFQLVEYPVKAAASMNYKFLFAQLSFLAEDDGERKNLSDLSEKAYEEIIALTEKYNNDMSDGKWKEMMTLNPRDLPVYAMPTYHLNDTSHEMDSTKNKKEATPTFIQANEFTKAFSTDTYAWKNIEGFGYSAASVTLFPFHNHSFSKELPYLEYTFNVDEPGTYNIEIRCIPTHSNNYDHQVSVEVNGTDRRSYSINTKGRSEAWKENVLRNYVPVFYSATFEKSGIQKLKIYVHQTGIVLDQIGISKKNNLHYYEIKR